MNQIIREAKVLIVDDNEENVAVVEQALRKAGYSFLHSTTDSRRAMSMVASLRPDLLILDLRMPAPDGFAILDQLTLSPNRDKLMAILVLTGDVAPGSKLKALSMGAKDFLTKPVDHVDLLIRMRTLLEWRYARLQAADEKARRVAAERTASAAEVEQDVLDRLAAIEACLDPDRARSGERIAELSAQIGFEMNLAETTLTRLRSAARLLDLGMLELPDSIRNSPEPLTAQERIVMKRHTVAAKQMFGETRYPALEMARDIAVGHHERWDGTGYPLGTKGAGTPLVSRIVAVAQVYDALVTDKPYRTALSPDEALAEVKRQAGYAFDPDVVAAFLRRMDVSRSVKSRVLEPAL